MDEILHGGVANAGAVVRRGDVVLRPSNPHTTSIHSMLSHVHESGFTGASQPLGVDPDGRERLLFIDGDVAIPPYPAWVRTDQALASVAVLLRGFHDSVRDFDSSHSTWSSEMADPLGGSVICHNDVCIENVVFRDGVAVGLLDFDFAAPGRPVYDLAQFARMCVPVDDEINSRRLGWESPNVFRRLRLVADAYGLPPHRAEFLDALTEGIERGGEFVRRRVDAGDPNFIAMWNEMGGMERFERRRRWFAEHVDQFAESLG